MIKPLVTPVGEGHLYLSGSGSYTDALHTDPIVQKNRPNMRSERMDNVYVCRYDGTDFVQWYGRKHDGRFYPAGEIMRLTAEGKRALKAAQNAAQERYRAAAEARA